MGDVRGTVDVVTTPINEPTTPHTVEGLLRVVEERDAEVVLLKNFFGVGKIEIILGLFLPRNFEDPVEVARHFFILFVVGAELH